MTILLVTNDDASPRRPTDRCASATAGSSEAHSRRSASIGVSLTARHAG